MKQILTIWRKELRDTVRDRRTLFAVILLPLLLMPVIIIGVGKLTQYVIRDAQEKVVTIGVVNESAAPELSQMLREASKVIVQSAESDSEDMVRNREIDAALVIPADAQAGLERDGRYTVSVVQNSLNDKSGLALQRISEVVARFNELLLASRLSAIGADASIMRGVDVQASETATEKELGGFGLGFLLPLFIIMWAVTGGQYTAVDVSAGEKERKTLEALLLTPARRIEIVLGKFLAVSTVAMLSVVLALTSLYTIFLFGGTDIFTGTATGSSGVSVTSQGGFDFSLQPAAILVMFAISIVLVALFSAINMTLAIFAKSYKEAQSYIGPSYLIVILPVVAFNSFPGFQPTDPFFAIPVVNAVLLFKEVLIGSYDAVHIALTLATLLFVAAAAILLATRIYQKESVLFKE